MRIRRASWVHRILQGLQRKAQESERERARLVEAVNDREEEFGEGRLLNLLEANAREAPDVFLNRTMTGLDAFVGETPQHDDVTCLLMKAA